MSETGHLRRREDKNGNPRYQMIIEAWRDGKKYFKSKTFSSEKQAVDWGRKTRYEIDKGLVTKESLKNRKLSHAIDKYIDQILPQKPKNARNVEQHLGWWKDRIGHVNLGDVSPSMIADGRDQLSKESTHQSKQRAPATVVRYLCSLSAVFEAAIKEWHWTEKNPARMIRKPSISNARTRFLEDDECKRLLASCKESRNPYLHSIVVLALSTGMRRGEILGLCWKDVDFDKKLIILQQTKNGSMRYVPMVGLAFQVLKAIFENETVVDLSYQVFPSLNLDRHLDVRTAWTFSLKRAGITGFTFHSLRHSCASFLTMSGASQRDIAEILGHKDLRMTHRYSHLSQQHLVDRMERAAEQFIGSEV
ncbi:MAG TPA: site-specific integrase [Chlamydiales bacterium]|nr:site-specific integrase [Chlamydiales bacterium]